MDPYREISIFQLWRDFLQQDDKDILDIAKRLIPSAEILFIGKTDDTYLHILSTRGEENYSIAEGMSLALDDSYCQYIYRNQLSSLHIDDSSQDPLVSRLPITNAAQIGSYIGVPLFDQHEKIYGTFCAFTKSKHAFSDTDIDILAKFSKVLTSLLRAQTLAITDGLTDCLNRTYMNLLRRSWSEREGNIYVATFDFDRFRQINDVYGHDVGDLVLQKFSDWLRQVWTENLVFRMGGDEFVVIGEGHLTASQTDQMKQLLNGSMQFIEETRLRVSIGIAYGTKGELSRVIRESDFGMYLHKGSHRRSSK